MAHHDPPNPATQPSTAAQPSASRRRRCDRGLTTLEWLLIVAAVAGLAALAVVLVQNVVDDTAEQISGSSARLTAARVAASEINEDCDEGTENTDGCGSDDTAKEDQAVAEAKAKCLRLVITYGDAFEEAGIDEDNLKAGPRDETEPKEKFLWDDTETTVTDKCKIPEV